MIVSSFPGETSGPLVYRNCNNLKNKELKSNKGNYGATVTLTAECLEDLTVNAQDNVNDLFKPKPSVF